jgi:uncharacterized protein (TIGR03437 family)
LNIFSPADTAKRERSSRFRSALTSVSAIIGGDNARVDFADQHGSFVGLDQLNILLPRTLVGRGDADVVLIVDEQKAHTVKVNIR